MAELAAAAILRCTSGFVDDVLSRPELRRRILASARLRVPSPLLAPALRRALSLLSQSPENSPAVEKLVLALPRATPLSSLLLALACGFRRRHVGAGLALLDLFSLDPALARTELAQPVFEGLFVPRLLPAVEWFSERRSRISSGAPRGGSKEPKGYARTTSFEPMTLLSEMSGEQAEELRELERGYEDTMDANCRIYAEYLKKVLEGSDDPCPELVYAVSSDKAGGLLGELKEEKEEEEFGSNGQYNNPMWGEGEEDQSAESSSPHGSAGHSENRRRATYHPRRVQPHILNMRRTTTDIARAARTPAPLPAPAYARDESFDAAAYSHGAGATSSEYEQELEETNIQQSLLHSIQDQDQKHEQPSVEDESSCSSTTAAMGDPDFLSSSGKQNHPPKDFVCPITSNVFDDPVTLETGQTYERAAIQEWLGRGNMTCPITRQSLSCAKLPKTNYVLKRLVAVWRDRNPTSTPNRSPPPPPPPPTSVTSRALSTDSSTSRDLRLAVSKLCASDLLAESETAVLWIERCWREREAGAERGALIAALSKPAVVNGFVEMLLNSASPRALAAAVRVLSEMASSRDGSVAQTLARAGSDVAECVAALLKTGRLAESAVLIYFLNPSWESLVEMDVVEALIATVGSRDDEGSPETRLGPKTASVLLLSRILGGGGGSGGTASEAARAVISGNAVERVVRRLDAELVEERVAAVGILVRCMEEDGKCRNMIADKAEIAPVLECFLLVNDGEKFEIVLFLYELVKLRRRSFNQQILCTIKDQGASSTMHALLVYLQTALRDQAPIVASLLLQLDLLVEPKKMSMYREEAIETLISCLKDSNFQNGQQIAAETIVSLQGRFSYSGKPLARAFLLKHAGMNKSFKAIMRSEQFGYAFEDSKEKLVEEKAAVEWESRVAFALASHEFGLMFEALAEGMRSKNASFFSSCLVSATWLVHMLSVLPDTGIRGAARHCLLKQYISILKSSNNLDDKALAMLAVRSFMNDADGMKDLSFYIKDILKTIRELKKSSVLANDMLKILSDGKESSSDIWNHKELNQVDCSTNGKVLSIVYFKNRIFSGHSDGTIKVWEGGARILDLIQESHEHKKAVTSLSILQSEEKLYSGSLDKTVRVWTVRDKNISCVEVHDLRDQVHNLTVANTIACFTPQGAGVKVFSWNGGSKLLNPNKSVKSLALLHGKLYCGCQDNSIQEIDLATGTLGAIQAGNRKLLGKSHPVHALQVHDGLLYSAGSSLDGTMIKIHNTSNYSQIGSLSTNLDVRTMAISTDLIYLGCRSGYVDIWSREKLTRVATLQLKTNSKVVCMSLDDDGDVLVVGTSDGRIQAWGLT